MEIATEAHKGQTSWDGEPYIEHPKRVASRFDIDTFQDEMLRAIAYLHDVLEDCEGWTSQKLMRELLRRGIEPQDAGPIVSGVVALTRLEGEPYVVSIARAAKSPLARQIKESDLLENTGRLPPKQTQRREKYLFSLAYIRFAGSLTPAQLVDFERLVQNDPEIAALWKLAEDSPAS